MYRFEETVCFAGYPGRRKAAAVFQYTNRNQIRIDPGQSKGGQDFHRKNVSTVIRKKTAGRPSIGPGFR